MELEFKYNGVFQNYTGCYISIIQKVMKIISLKNFDKYFALAIVK